MRRREFITLLGGTAAWPFSLCAQEIAHTYRLGFLIPGPREMLAAFFDELRLHGFIEGQNVTVVPSGFDVRNEQLAELAAALVKAAPDVIVGGPELPLRALKEATQTIPLFGMTEDMVAAGLVASLARPGGNVTGISLLSLELDGKRQELLMETIPGLRRMGALLDANVTSTEHIESLRNAARVRGVELLDFRVATPEEIVPAINAAKAAGVEALNFLATPLFSVPASRNSRVVLERVAALRLPAIYQWPETAKEGGFAGYGASFTQVFRQRARMVVKVLRGAKPADIPVEQPTKFELVINLKTAKTLGIEVPDRMLALADEVIE
jgi:putative ABC transport system substrate-binding protein